MDQSPARRLRRLLAVPFVAFTALLFMPSLSFAQEAPAPLVTEGEGNQLIISNPVWTIVVGVLLPFVVGLITKASANDRFQAIVGIVVAALGAIVVRATQVDGSAIFTQALVLDVFLVYSPQLLSYLGVYKKFELNSKLAPNRGLG